MISTIKTESYLRDTAKAARKAAHLLAAIPHDVRCNVLSIGAELMEERTPEILEANEKDCAVAASALREGTISSAFFRRLQTSQAGIAHMIKQVRDVADLPDPLKILSRTELDDHLILNKVACPIGVIGIVFESRPDIIPQIVALALKSGNAVLLKGGAESINTNSTLVEIWHQSMKQVSGVPPEAVCLLHTREEVSQMLHQDCYIDLIIPRGSREFVRSVAEQSSIPVLGHGEGLCHIYVDRSADLRMAHDVVFDSKTQYPAACNSVETLLVHEEIAAAFLPVLLASFGAAGVEVRGCERTVAQGTEVIRAIEDDWQSEYSDLIISIKIVRGLVEALDHIDRYGSRHTECILAEDAQVAEEFLQKVDAAGVYHNASTRFADGYRYGLGAELGISNGKLHARGPVGLEGLTTYKYTLEGRGQTVADYSNGKRTFKHRILE